MNLEKPKNNQLWSFANISSSNEPRGRATRWEMNSFGIAKSAFFWKLSQVSVMQLQSKTQNINFWVLQIYLVQINPGDVLVLGKWILLVLEKVWFFRNFHVSVIKLPGKKSKNQFSSFPNISSSNEPRGCANHWEINSFGIGKSQIFSKFS